MEDIKVLQEMTDRVLAEAGKKKKNEPKVTAPVVQPAAYSYSEALDFAIPLGDHNLYKTQGQVNWGPHTGVGPYIDDSPRWDSNKQRHAEQSSWEKLKESFMPEAEGTWGEAACAVEDIDEADGIDEKHIGFRKLKGQLSHEKGVHDAGALAASIGRKKYGAKAFAAKAAAGRK